MIKGVICIKIGIKDYGYFLFMVKKLIQNHLIQNLSGLQSYSNKEVTFQLPTELSMYMSLLDPFNFIGCRSDDELNSRLPAQYTKSYQAKYLPFWPTIFIFASESSVRSLRSSSGRKCSVTRVQSRFGDRCFAAAGPRIWNNLPASLRDTKFR